MTNLDIRFIRFYVFVVMRQGSSSSFRLGPEHMPQMHRSHVGLLCYPRTILVF